MTRRLLSLFIAFIFLLVGCDGAIDASSTNDKQAIQEKTNEKQTEEKTNVNLEELKAHYIDVGQADATFFQFRDGDTDHNILLDTGNFNSSNALEYLQKHDIDHIDVIAITHPHADLFNFALPIITKKAPNRMLSIPPL